MNVSVLVPFRDDGAMRGEIWEWLEKRWLSVFSDFELCVADSVEHEEFSRSRARNNAFAKSTGDIVVIADADSCPSTRALLSAIDIVEEDPSSWVIAHDAYAMLNEEFTVELLKQPASVVLPDGWSPDCLVRPMFQSYAGMLVCSRASFDKVNGYDERFGGWGLEDWAFRLAMDTLVSPHKRVSGALSHFYHGPPQGDEFDTPPEAKNQALYSYYKANVGNVENMTKLVNHED